MKARFSRTCPDRPWGPPSLLYNGYRVFPGGKERPGRDPKPSAPSSAVGHERVELYLYSPYGPYGLYRASVPVQGVDFTFFQAYKGCRDSSVGIGTRYWLDGPRIKSWWGARLSAPVQTDPAAHPASCTIGTGSFPGVKSGRGVTLTPHPLLVPLVMKE